MKWSEECTWYASLQGTKDLDIMESRRKEKLVEHRSDEKF
jgi:hypothetical protein